MSQKVVVIGGVALGPKVACRIKRLDPHASVTIIDKDRLISYGGCGIPYYVSGDVPELKDLYSTSAHVVRDAKFFANAKGVEVQTETEAIAIDREKKTVTVRKPDGETALMPYDKLVLATGALPVQPPIPGVDLPGVSVVATLHHAAAIKDRIAKGDVGKARGGRFAGPSAWRWRRPLRICGEWRRRWWRCRIRCCPARWVPIWP